MGPLQGPRKLLTIRVFNIRIGYRVSIIVGRAEEEPKSVLRYERCRLPKKSIEASKGGETRVSIRLFQEQENLGKCIARAWTMFWLELKIRPDNRDFDFPGLKTVGAV
jgi:hypothetical protein